MCNTLKGKCFLFPKVPSFNDGVPEDVPAYICIPGSIVAFLKGVLVLVAAIRQVTDGFYVKPASHTVMLECLWVESMQAGVALKQLQSNLHHEADGCVLQV